ncbi:hypothetical protein [Escherichia coli]|nr:hypothetical protein [Escherichia coli]MCN7634542.1 hypothetical protein [Escherichia coli]
MVLNVVLAGDFGCVRRP